MGGSLWYGDAFSKEEYVADDGQHHYELTAINGDYFHISNDTWRAIVAYCADWGISEELWPEFEDGIDIPIDEVVEKSARIREKLSEMSTEERNKVPWLQEFWERIETGKAFYFAQT